MRFKHLIYVFFISIFFHNVQSMTLKSLERIEKEFWENDCPKSSLSSKKKSKEAVTKIFDPKISFVPSGTINLSNMYKWEIVKHLDAVQATKLKARTSNNHTHKYDTSFDRSGNGDPNPELIAYEGRNFRFSLNYNGYFGTKQPGNFYFQELEKQPLTYNDCQGITLDNPDVKLLLLGEISRRHAYDPSRRGNQNLNNGYDEFKDLPVSLGLAMASKMIRSKQIELASFWEKPGAYHLYTGSKGEREVALFKLYEQYESNYLNDLSEDKKKELHLKNLLKEYFQLEEVDNNISFLFYEKEEQSTLDISRIAIEYVNDLMKRLHIE